MNILSGMKVSHKISSLIIGLAVGFLLMGVALYAQISADIKYDTITEQAGQTQQSLMRIESAYNDLEGAGGSISSAEYQSLIERIETELGALSSTDPRYRDSAAIETMREAVGTIATLSVDDLAVGTSDFENRPIAAQGAWSSFTGALDSYQQSLATIRSARLEKASQELTVARVVFASVLFLTAVGTTLGMYLIYRGIMLPLWHIQATIARQNQGDSEARVSLKGHDELANLGRAFNRLLDERIHFLHSQAQENERLNNSIITLIKSLGMIAQKDLTVKVPVSSDVTGTVSDAVNLLTSETALTLQEVTEISEKVNAVADILQNQSQQVLGVSETERRQINEANQSLIALSKAMNQVANEARVTNKIAQTAITHTHEAQESVSQTVDGIQTIRSSIFETEKRIKRLGERSQEITGIVNMINTIAERTHILALNASMHAASAGEAGKGFAVVAEEVQRLAENSRSATSEISAMVNNIRVETSDTVEVMNQLISHVTEGTRLAEQSGKTIRETESATEQLVDHVKSIAINAITQAKNASRVTAQANELMQSTETTRAKLLEQHQQTDSLKHYARSLVDNVSVFTLPSFQADANRVVQSVRTDAPNQPPQDTGKTA